MENLEEKQPVTEESIVPETKPPMRPLYIILLCFLMFVLGGGLVFAYFTFLKPGKVVSQPTISPTPLPSLAPSPSVRDETVDCESGKTFIDTRYNFSIWCPAGWFATPAAEGYGTVTTFTNYDRRTAPGRMLSPGENKFKMDVTVLEKEPDLLFEEWAEKTIMESLSSSVAKDYGEELELREDIEVSGVIGKKYVISSNLGSSVRIVLPSAGMTDEVYSIRMGPEQVFDQILSTFKFTE